MIAKLIASIGDNIISITTYSQAHEKLQECLILHYSLSLSYRERWNHRRHFLMLAKRHEATYLVDIGPHLTTMDSYAVQTTHVVSNALNKCNRISPESPSPPQYRRQLRLRPRCLVIQVRKTTRSIHLESGHSHDQFLIPSILVERRDSFIALLGRQYSPTIKTITNTATVGPTHTGPPALSLSTFRNDCFG